MIYPLLTFILSIFISILYLAPTEFRASSLALCSFSAPNCPTSQLHPLSIPNAPLGSVLSKPELCPLHSCSLLAFPLRCYTCHNPTNPVRLGSRVSFQEIIFDPSPIRGNFSLPSPRRQWSIIVNISISRVKYSIPRPTL